MAGRREPADASAGAAEEGEASPWRDGAGADLPEEMLPSSLMPPVARDGTLALGSTAPSARSNPPSSHAVEAVAARRRNRTIVATLLALLACGAVALAVLSSAREADESAIDIATGKDAAAAPPTEAADTLGQEARDEPRPEGSETDGGAVATPQSIAVATAARKGTGAGGRTSPSSTARAAASSSPASSPTARSSPAPAPTPTGGSSGLFFEKGSD
jgi:serine/threonine-protein kinase